MDLAPGLTGRSDLTVSVADTARALGSGDVDVLGTPRVVALCEAATVAALAGRLDAGTTSVGTRVEVDHLRPSRIGAAVTAQATLSGIDGGRLTFEVEAREGDTVVARGLVVRAVVRRDRF